MRYLTDFKIFESKKPIDSINKGYLSQLNNFCTEFLDNGCDFEINFDEIINSGYYNFCNPYGFYITIKIDTEIYRKISSIYLPDWFISRCNEIEEYMKDEGFETRYTVTNGKSKNVIILKPHEKLSYVDMVIGELVIHFLKKN